MNILAFLTMSFLAAVTGIMITTSDVVWMGLLQGVTEYLPVSSTGHTIVLSRLLTSKAEVLAVLDQYNIVLQGGSIAAAVVVFFPRFLGILVGILGKNPLGFQLGVNLVLAFIPSGIVGFFLGKTLQQGLFSLKVVGFGLIAGAFLMFYAEKYRSRRLTGYDIPERTVDQITPIEAIVVGFFQCMAFWPGFSRSMATIVGGYFLGLDRRNAAMFSFMLGAITLTVACGYQLMTSWDELSTALPFWPAVWGLIIAFASGIIVIRVFLWFIGKYGLNFFGVYRVFLGIFVLYLGFRG